MVVSLARRWRAWEDEGEGEDRTQDVELVVHRDLAPKAADGHLKSGERKTRFENECVLYFGEPPEMNTSKTFLKTESFLIHASGVHLAPRRADFSAKLTRLTGICTGNSKEPKDEILDRNATKHFAITFDA